MNIVMECEVTLSKKLQALCEEGEPISIHVNPVHDNKGRALIRMAAKDGTKISDAIAVGETSLMFKVVAADHDAASLSGGPSFGSLFAAGQGKIPAAAGTDNPSVPAGDPHPELRPPSVPPGLTASPMDSAPHAEITVGDMRRGTASSPGMTGVYVPAGEIMSYPELIAELSGVRNIEEDFKKIPEGQKLNRAQAVEMERSIPRLRRKVFIGNELMAQLVIQDMLAGPAMCVSIPPKGIFDLSRVPAKQIRDSADLRWCLENGKVTFKTQDEHKRWSASISRTASKDSPLPVFDSIDAAADAFVSQSERDFVPIPGVSAPSNVLVDIDQGGPKEDGKVLYEGDSHMESIVSSLPPDKSAAGRPTSGAIPPKLPPRGENLPGETFIRRM